MNALTGTLPSQGRYSVLNLSSNSMTGYLPSGAQLPNLTALDLSYNSITGGLPDWSMPALLQLDLSSNMISGSLPDGWGAYPIRDNTTGTVHTSPSPLQVRAFCCVQDGVLLAAKGQQSSAGCFLVPVFVALEVLVLVLAHMHMYMC